jgi:hypothetical protein
MVRENPTWGQRRVASELALKLGIHISPRTIRAYWPEELGPSHRRDAQCWMTFVRNHAKAMVACDFAVAVTLWFQILYLFVVLDLGMDAQELARLQEEAKDSARLCSQFGESRDSRKHSSVPLGQSWRTHGRTWVCWIS